MTFNDLEFKESLGFNTGIQSIVRFENNYGVSVVASPGARAAAWPVKVKSHSSYNIYNVRAVVVGLPGSEPSEIGGQMKAVNLAESFVEEGQLSGGTYVVMFRVGRKNVFYVPV